MDNRRSIRRIAVVRQAVQTEAANWEATQAPFVKRAKRRIADADRLEAFIAANNVSLDRNESTGKIVRVPEVLLREIDRLRSEAELDEQAKSRAIMRLLTDPLDAMLGAWHYERDKEIPSDFAMGFARALRTSCSGKNREQFATLLGAPLDAFPVFARTLNALAATWKKYRPDSVAWMEDHPNEYRRMHEAQLRCSPITAIPPERARWLEEFGTDESSRIREMFPDADTAPAVRPLEIRMLHRQRTYKQAAKTAAFVLWGNFLLSQPELIDFCRKCSSPFPSKSNQLYCERACGKNSSSLKCNNNGTRRKNAKRMRDVARRLKKWLNGGNWRHRGDWRKEVDPKGSVKPNLTRLDRRSRWLFEFIAAALAPVGSREVEEQFELCFDTRQGETEKARTRAVFDDFLSNIREAERLTQLQQGR